MEESGADYDTVLVDLQDKPTDFVELYARANPMKDARAKVPVLHVVRPKEEDVVLCESLVVAEYVAELFGNNVEDGSLLPHSLEDRAKMKLFTELCSPCFSYFPILRERGDKLESAIEKFKEGLVNADALLTRLGGQNQKGPFLFGTRFSLAECNLAPFVQRACTVLPAFTTQESSGRPVNPISICEELGLVRLKEWIEAIIARPSVVKTSVPKDEMVKNMAKMLERFKAMEEGKQQS